MYKILLHGFLTFEIIVRDIIDMSLNNEKIIVRKTWPKIKEFRDFLPQDFDTMLAKMRKDDTASIFNPPDLLH